MRSPGEDQRRIDLLNAAEARPDRPDRASRQGALRAITGLRLRSTDLCRRTDRRHDAGLVLAHRHDYRPQARWIIDAISAPTASVLPRARS